MKSYENGILVCATSSTIGLFSTTTVLECSPTFRGLNNFHVVIGQYQRSSKFKVIIFSFDCRLYAKNAQKLDEYLQLQ